MSSRSTMAQRIKVLTGLPVTSTDAAPEAVGESQLTMLFCFRVPTVINRCLFLLFEAVGCPLIVLGVFKTVATTVQSSSDTSAREVTEGFTESLDFEGSSNCVA
ncbi:hypothetical protein L596_001619 [Steinernema carpocapsae]|uniref:Uncharacterized protein n=1 Tax=Steinernema carpocapsae TaxID=34508 RepID=A0A4U8UQP1_STECR|nr:hypothetical protein L596_001619 [Steinernema carpocapsae]